ncbi:MAG: Lrp/AsnC ligand binding domain-containing protein [Thaumarchaeota archaeon]|jgi:DNA-binding Lrp family transcriptional regulator|nr:Lrp/AsnC ligand binding domain-containing protein [Candidatus Terraquivivens yellowstonensis]MCL7398299.1 Lrp/AsnC ligand binding domain-containing protein [Candidatus Terraquivivens yellowstonensis]MCL7400269.1 Lrp/AsnC ligand binding domain-containing protein [Candidatus Terraquivivens yellowstonensis]
MTILVVLHIYVESNKLDHVCKVLNNMSEVTDVFEVSGDYDIIAIMETESISKFREILKTNILKIEGIKAIASSIVLHTHKRSGEVLEV